MGIWTPSPFWTNPKPVGTYYMGKCLCLNYLPNCAFTITKTISATIAVVAPTAAFIGVFVRGRLRRFFILATFFANFILATGIACVVQALPISGAHFCRRIL